MKYIRGFLMAWGNFTALPCPYHRWHDDSRKAMLCMMPPVGMMVAGVVIAAWWLLDMAGASQVLTGAILTAVYFCSCGFIHLDGFMDCSDAILSRRSELEERQRILKSPDVGAFAVVSVVLALLIFAASMMELAQDFSFKRAGILLIITAISRGIAADSVGRKTVMRTSQYADLRDMKFTFAESALLNLWAVLPVLAVPNISDFGIGKDAFEYLAYFAGATLTVLAVAIGCGAYARRKLGGMNGDIAGYMIVMSETAAVAAAAVASACVGL